MIHHSAKCQPHHHHDWEHWVNHRGDGIQRNTCTLSKRYYAVLAFWLGSAMCKAREVVHVTRPFAEPPRPRQMQTPLVLPYCTLRERVEFERTLSRTAGRIIVLH